ncbi:molybdopterin-dependent oxidoreductase [uncultured Aureimonas sp.]|uniref:molybdopterin-dependent oxidoreductase n=1 Tax=uncultured Aureimonas sp. TaxID=1604662 RepID=UPI0025E81767|nr:molybdopterin-dependent oxidoreductase [uncultured Aureimonas sp.]
MDRRTLLMGMGALALSGWIVPALADEPILTLRGKFARAGADGSATLSLADLDALPQTRFRTTTPWHSGAVEFSGVSVSDFLAAMGVPASESSMQLIALNDYVVETKAAELVSGDALLATRMNGEPMSVQDKGPIFVVFPFDSRSALQHQSYYSRAVWQLAEIDLAP